MLKDFGMEGQEKLSVASVLVAGAGGLGCPALQYLVAAGVGTIGIIDCDKVELSNLQRQTLFTVDDIGRYKAEAATDKLSRLNPEIKIQAFNEKLHCKNAVGIVKKFDMLIDGTDNFATRYMLNDACVLTGKPYIYGAVLRYEGQIGVFNLTEPLSGIVTNYRDLFPTAPEPDTVPSCSEAGVLGVVPAVIGSLQAAEAIKIITGIGVPLANRVLTWNVLNNLFYELTISPAEHHTSIAPKTLEEFSSFNYDWFCGFRNDIKEITPSKFNELLQSNNIIVIDVRNPDERPAVKFDCLKIPLPDFEMEMSKIDVRRPVILFCKTGGRSMKAARLLKNKFVRCEVYNLDGGIEALLKYNCRNDKFNLSIT